jgi:hypothetical protein
MSQNVVLQSIEKVLRKINTERPPYEILSSNEQLQEWLPDIKELCHRFKLKEMEMVVICMLILDDTDSMRISEDKLFTKLSHQMKMPKHTIRQVIKQLKKNEIIEQRGRMERNSEIQLNEKFEEAVYSGDWKKIEALNPVGLLPFLSHFLKKRGHNAQIMSEFWESMVSHSVDSFDIHFDGNEDLACIKFIRKHFEPNNGPAFQVGLFLTVLANKVFRSRDTHVNRAIMELDMPSFEADEFINRFIKTGDWAPIRMGYFEIAGGGQLDEDIDLTLTPNGIIDLLPELEDSAKEFLSNKPKLNIPLLLPENIKSIELLFDEQMLETLSPLRQALSPEVLPRIKELSKARNVGVCALLYGHPGTGKTEWCYQLAKEYDLPIYEVNVSDIQDKWVGNSEKNARRVFNEYKRICKYYKKDVILLFNEADALFGKRLEAQQSVDQMNNALKNIFLEEMEKMDGILLATTNLSQSLDPAFERRFLFKFKFLKPNNSTQCRLWMKYFDEINEEQANQLSKHFDLSPAQISNVQRRLEIERILYPNIELLATIERLANTEKLEDPNDKKVMGF